MTHKNTKLVLITLFLVLLSMMTVTSAAPLDSPWHATAKGVPTPGAGSYFDTFTSTTYYDNPNTTAFGWGAGTIMNPRAAGLLTHLDTLILPDEVYSVELQGRKLYATLYDPLSSVAVLRTFNVTDPTDIQQLGYRGTTDGLVTGEVDGDVMVIGDVDSWLGIYNVSDPANIPTPLDTMSFTTGSITDVEIQGRHMYVAIYERATGNDLSIYDIEDPSNPIYTDGEEWSELLGLDVQGDILYLAGGTYGLYLMNVSNHYDITQLGSYNTLGNATDVVVDGDIAYVADGTTGGIQVIDCSDPTSPTLLDNYNTPGAALDVELHGDTLCVADGWYGVRFFDVSDPTDIRFVYGLSADYARDIDIQDGILAIAGGDTIYLVRIGDLTSPTLYSTYSTYDALDVEVQGDIAYIAAGSDGLVVLDISDRVNPVLLDVGKHTSTVYYSSVDVQGIHCFVTHQGAGTGLYSFDVSDPTSIAYLDTDANGNAYDVAIAGDFAFYANGLNGICTLNVSDPWNIGPTPLDSEGTIYNCSTVAVQGRFAYAGGIGTSSADRGIFVYDLMDLTSTYVTGNRQLVEVKDIDVCGDYLAVADGSYGVYLYNITDPWNIPGPLDYYNLPSDTVGVKIYGNYIFAAERGAGFYILNATDPTDLTLLSSYTTGSPDCLSIDCDGDFAYVACRDKLMIFRVFNSIGDTWDTDIRYAQSLEVDTTDRTIENATFSYEYDINFGSSGVTIGFELSADGGANWESVVEGSLHTFVNQGHKLLWRATLSSSYNDRTPLLTEVDIDYEYNDLPTTPVLTDPGTTDDDGAFTVSWSASTDDSAVSSYHVQMSNVSTFLTSTNWYPTTTSKAISVDIDDVYYFRVRATDNDGESGAWSNVEQITVAITMTTGTPPPNPMLLIIGVIVVVVIVMVLLLLYFLFFKKKK